VFNSTHTQKKLTNKIAASDLVLGPLNESINIWYKSALLFFFFYPRQLLYLNRYVFSLQSYDLIFKIYRWDLSSI
jgi:hypothetical protein